MATATEEIQLVQKREAVMCVDCGAISNTKSTQCPQCASVAVMSLARVLDRDEQKGAA